MPEVIDPKAVRGDYEKLLGHYQALADAMVMLRVTQPADFRAKGGAGRRPLAGTG